MSADRNSDAAIDALLKAARVFAVVGASNKPERPSYGVMQALIAHGYEVHPINPGFVGQKILGRTVYAALSDVPTPVDVVDIFRNADDALGVVREALALREKLSLKCVWMQLGVINAQAADEAVEAGLVAVMDRCPAIEFARGAGR